MALHMSKLLPSPAASGGVGQPQLAPVQAGAQRRALLPAHAPLRGHRHHHRGPLLAAAPACASRNPTAGLEQGVADQHGGSQQQQRRQHQGLHSVSNITRIISRHRGALLAARSSPTASSLASIANDEPHESTPLGASADSPGVLKALYNMKPPKWLFRTIACLVLGGQVIVRICKGNVHWRNTMDQLKLVGPKSLGVALLTAGFVGMVFTIQFVREFTKLGLTRSVGGVMALALSRELTPVVTAIILAGRVGSAFAAELGTMQVSEQMDSLRVLFTDPVDYLVTPRVLASMVAGPILNVLCFCMGIGASVLLADLVYSVPANVIVDSARRALTAYDVMTSMVKSWVFGSIVATISCAWGFTTSGGAKGVGESTTSAVVISLVSIFVADFVLSFLFYQGQGDALKQLK